VRNEFAVAPRFAHASTAVSLRRAPASNDLQASAMPRPAPAVAQLRSRRPVWLRGLLVVQRTSGADRVETPVDTRERSPPWVRPVAASLAPCGVVSPAAARYSAFVVSATVVSDRVATRALLDALGARAPDKTVIAGGGIVWCNGS
jgi:hypothetical protein